MTKLKTLLAKILSPSIVVAGATLSSCVCLTSCSLQYNSLDDFEYRISSIAQYTAFLDTKQEPEIPQGIKTSFANEVGIIITGWKDNSKPKIINKNKTVLIHPKDSYTVTEDGKKTKYHVIAFGEHAFGKEMFDQYNLENQKKENNQTTMIIVLFYRSTCTQCIIQHVVGLVLFLWTKKRFMWTLQGL